MHLVDMQIFFFSFHGAFGTTKSIRPVRVKCTSVVLLQRTNSFSVAFIASALVSYLQL